MLFLSAFLYQGLPQFLNNTRIEFKTKLHQKIGKTIEISNLTFGRLVYTVALEGPPEFKLGKGSISLDEKKQEPYSIETLPDNTILASMPQRSIMKFPIEFCARFTRAASGSLCLKSKTVALNNISMINYELSSFVEQSTPNKTFFVEAPLYHFNPPASALVEIENPFDSTGEFIMTVKQRFLGSPNSPKQRVASTKVPLHQSTHNQDEFNVYNIPSVSKRVIIFVTAHT